MKIQPLIKLLLLGPLLALVAGCATYPISKNLRVQARRVTFTQAIQNPGAVRGTTVIWGGRIVRTANNTNGAAIYVMMLPLNSDEWPEPRAGSPGRFIARSPQFLDPDLLARGRLVTIAGTLNGVESGRVQQAPYTYPVLNVEEVHIWRRVRHPYGGWFYPNVYSGWGYPGGYGAYWGYWGDPDRGPDWGWYDPDDWY